MGNWQRFAIFKAWPGIKVNERTTGVRLRFPYARDSFGTLDQAKRNLQPGECVIYDCQETGIVAAVAK